MNKTTTRLVLLLMLQVPFYSFSMFVPDDYMDEVPSGVSWYSDLPSLKDMKNLGTDFLNIGSTALNWLGGVVQQARQKGSNGYGAAKIYCSNNTRKKLNALYSMVPTKEQWNKFLTAEKDVTYENLNYLCQGGKQKLFDVKSATEDFVRDRRNQLCEVMKSGELKATGTWANTKTALQNSGKYCAKFMRKGISHQIKEGIKDELEENGVVEKVKTELINPAINGIDKKVDDKIQKMVLWGAGAVAVGVGSWLLWKYLNRPVLEYTKIAPTVDNASDHEMIFSPEITDCLHKLLSSTETVIKISNGPTFAHMLFYGPRGLGKRMAAKELAQSAGMNFYEINGSSLAQFKGNESSGAIDGFFNGIQKEARPVIVYVDNAGILFEKGTSTDLNQAIESFVEKAKKHAHKCMMIFSISEKPYCDSEALSLINGVIEFKRPELAERKRLLLAYSSELGLNDNKIDALAEQLDGFSAAEIVGFVDSLKREIQLSSHQEVSVDELINHILGVSKQLKFV